jgi:hypothetical protein
VKAAAFGALWFERGSWRSWCPISCGKTTIRPETFALTDRNPRIISPAAGAVLTSSPCTFAWTAVAGAEDYWIDVGTEPRKGDIFEGLTGGARSKAVNIGSFLNGRTLYVQLHAKLPHANLAEGTGNNYAFATGAQ